MIMTALISPDELYRYSLKREWGEGPRCVFVMLNPSTADHRRDDPTIRRCIAFAQREGCGVLEVVNLFAFRTPFPRILQTVEDPIGPLNDQLIKESFSTEGPLIAAWGNNGFYRDRHREILDLVPAKKQMQCLGYTKIGAPRHPLYLPADEPLQEYTP